MSVTVTLRMDSVLEKEISRAAKSQGVTRSQFLINAAQLALGKQKPYALLHELKALELHADSPEAIYETGASRAALVEKLKVKHGVGAG